MGTWTYEVGLWWSFKGKKRSKIDSCTIPCADVLLCMSWCTGRDMEEDKKIRYVHFCLVVPPYPHSPSYFPLSSFASLCGGTSKGGFGKRPMPRAGSRKVLWPLHTNVSSFADPCWLVCFHLSAPGQQCLFICRPLQTGLFSFVGPWTLVCFLKVKTPRWYLGLRLAGRKC